MALLVTVNGTTARMTPIKNMGPNEYQCAACGEVYEKGWTDEDAASEREENGWSSLECEVVCDDCYKMMMGEMPVS